MVLIPTSYYVVCAKLYGRVPEGKAPSVDKVIESFTAWYSKDETEEVFGEDSEYDDDRKVLSV